MKTNYIRRAGLFIQQTAESKGLSRSELAEKLGVDKACLRKLFYGQRNITAQLAVKFERVLGVPAEEILRLKAQDELELARNVARMVAHE